jgi:hypothetical protein
LEAPEVLGVDWERNAVMSNGRKIIAGRIVWVFYRLEGEKHLRAGSIFGTSIVGLLP